MTALPLNHFFSSRTKAPASLRILPLITSSKPRSYQFVIRTGHNPSIRIHNLSAGPGIRPSAHWKAQGARDRGAAQRCPLTLVDDGALLYGLGVAMGLIMSNSKPTINSDHLRSPDHLVEWGNWMGSRGLNRVFVPLLTDLRCIFNSNSLVN